MKGKKLMALLMTMLMVCTIMPAAVFAGVTDVDEGHDAGITITNTYTSNITVTILEVDADGRTIQNIDKQTESVPFDLGSAEGQTLLQTLDASAKAKYETGYTLYDKDEASEVHYSSQQVLNTDGDVIIVGDVDDLVNAYIANGKVTDHIQIDKYETYQIVYKVIKKESAKPQDITSAKITGVTVGFKPGDAPVFTAESAEPDLYYVYLERWYEVDGDKYITSSDFFNRDEELLITEFEDGKEYSYMVWLKPAETEDDDGNFTGYKTSLSACRTVLINGESYTLTDDMVTDEEDAGIFLYPDFKISVSAKQDAADPDDNTTTDPDDNTTADPDDDTTTNPPAGDGSRLPLWIVLAVVSGVAATMAFCSPGRKEA